MVSSADVLIENYRPGVMERFGLGPAALSLRYPRLIYLSMPGFASEDPQQEGMRAWEAAIMAAGGVFSDMGLNRVLMGVNPCYSALPLASTYSASLGAYAVTLALFAREA